MAAVSVTAYTMHVRSRIELSSPTINRPGAISVLRAPALGVATSMKDRSATASMPRFCFETEIVAARDVVRYLAD
jgi:hypothetical protein